MLNEEELKDAALLVFANKQDQPGAKGAGEISEALRLGELRDRNWSIMACSAVDGSGINEGMDWLVVSCASGLPCLAQGSRMRHNMLTILPVTANRQPRVERRIIKSSYIIERLFSLDIELFSHSPFHCHSICNIPKYNDVMKKATFTGSSYDSKQQHRYDKSGSTRHLMQRDLRGRSSRLPSLPGGKARRSK